MSEKLAARGYEPDSVADVLDHLVGKGLLSDERFTSEYVAMRIRKGFGPIRIRAELGERGVAPELIRQALDSGAYDWRELLREAAQSRFGSLPPADRSEVAKRARFLTQRGFQESLVREFLLD